MKKGFYIIIVFLCFLISCKKQDVKNIVAIRVTQDPETLSTVNYNSETSSQIINLLYQSLRTVDLADGKQKPLLAENHPKVVKEGNNTLIEYTIRKEATWNNGSPVTANDVAFSLKVLKSPLVQNDRVKPIYEFIEDIRIDPDNSKHFFLVTQELTPENEFLTGDFFILPEYIVDPKGLLREFTLPDLIQRSDALSQNSKVKEFAEWFNNERFARDKNFLQGSGGYELEEWKTGQFVRLKKKQNWWGNKVSNANSYITANPERITFQIIPENATALLALRNEQLDVYQEIPISAFQELAADKNFTEKYKLHSPDTYEFTYIGLNSRQSKLADPLTRQALAHLMDVDQIIKATQKGYATRTIGPVNPINKNFYNRAIQPYQYNLAQVQQLLQTAGWQKKLNGWEREMNGQLVPLTLTVNYKAGKNDFENIALIFQQAAAKVNIPVTIQPLEGALLSKNSKAHTFDVIIRSITGSPFAYNYKAILHTESAAEGGGNYTGFGTPESDKLIDQINQNNNQEEKATLLKRLQEILHEQSNLIFLYFSKERVAIHQRFSNTKVSPIKPGYDVSAFTLQED